VYFFATRTEVTREAVAVIGMMKLMTELAALPDTLN
jgi:hypothetical protein